MREECIFIPLKIAMRKRCKNAVGGVVHEAIQITAESDLSTEQRCLRVQHTFSSETSLVLLIQLRPRESSVSTMVW